MKDMDLLRPLFYVFLKKVDVLTGLYKNNNLVLFSE